MKKKYQRVLFPAVSFLLPVLVMFVVYLGQGIYPGGEKSILTIDLNNQYVSFLSYLREMLAGERGFFYSFSKTLGGDMAGLNAYYLMSPLNAVLLLFPTEQLPLAIELLTLIKLGLCGLTFYLCVTGNKSWHGLFFSTSYALMAYNIVYQQNIMWLDGVILLPVVILGIRRIVENRAPFLYLFSLFAAILTNYYIGFMICIFSVLFFLYAYFCEKRGKLWDIPVLLRFGASSLLGGGLSMWLLLPTLRSLEGGKAVFDLSLLTMDKVFPLRDFLLKLFGGSFDYNQIITGHPEQEIPLPNVYCGMLALVFAGLFFLNKRIALRKKAGALLLFGILTVSFYLKGFNMVWHGLNEPVWFPFRFSFVFSFLILYFAWEGFCRAEDFSLTGILISVALVFAVLVAVALYEWGRPYEFLAAEKYAWNLLTVVLTGLLFLCYRRTKKQVFMTGLLLVCCGDLFANGMSSLGAFSYASYENYQAFVRDAEPAVEYVRDLDDGFYRMEKTFNRKESDPMLLNYMGLSHYSSTEKARTKYFMGQLGFRNNTNWAYYNRGSSYAADSLLNVKYVLSKTEIGEPYQLLDKIGDVLVYENPYALGIGFLSDAAVLDVSIDNGHKFELQNEIWASLEGQVEKPLFCPEDVGTPEAFNLEQDPASPYTYHKVNEEKNAALVYTFEAKTDDPVFAWFGTESMAGAKVKVNDTWLGDYFTIYDYDILRLGSFKKGETVTVAIYPAGNDLSVTDVWVYYQDLEATQEYYDHITEGKLAVETASDTRISGSVENHTGKEYLVLTVPADKGWHIYVDGEEKPVETAMGLFAAVQVPEGSHQVELRFRAPGFRGGILLSGLSAGAALLWVVLWMRKQKKRSVCLTEKN